MITMSWADVLAEVGNLGSQIPAGAYVYGVPRGGSIIVGLMSALNFEITAVSVAKFADHIVDDIVDSGATWEHIAETYPSAIFHALIDKHSDKWREAGWIVFPWEESLEQDMQHSIRRIIQAIGEDSTRPGLVDTPKRVTESWRELYRGYTDEPVDLKLFLEPGSDEMVIVRGIEVWSTCEHHMLPFFGKANLAYLPRESQVIGVSKLARLVDHFARRLQVQERLVMDIGKALDHVTNGCAVSIEAQHCCMMARGIKQADSTMLTNYVSGAFKDDPMTRSEFFASVR